MTWLRGLMYNLGIMLVIVVLGFIAFAINDWFYRTAHDHGGSHKHKHGHRHHKYPNDNVDVDQEFVLWSQVLGYGSAILYRQSMKNSITI